jgi:hypothetical protein
VWIAELAGAKLTGGSARRIGLAAVAVALVALTLPWSIPRVHELVQQANQADQAALLQKRLFLAVDRAGGARTVLPCRSSRVAVNHSVATALAWKLEVPLRRVMPAMRGTGYVFRAPHFIVTGSPPPIARLSARTVRTVAVVAPWRVLEVTRRGASATPRCARGDASPLRR